MYARMPCLRGLTGFCFACASASLGCAARPSLILAMRAALAADQRGGPFGSRIADASGARRGPGVKVRRRGGGACGRGACGEEAAAAIAAAAAAAGGDGGGDDEDEEDNGEDDEGGEDNGSSGGARRKEDGAAEERATSARARDRRGSSIAEQRQF